MSNINDLVIALNSSPLVLAAEVSRKIEEDGWFLSRECSKCPIQCSELFSTYKIRNDGLAKQTSEHAVQLYASTSEFLISLELNFDKSCFINTIAGSEEHDYLVFIESEEGGVLGVMKIYSQLKVSSERWLEIWKKP